MRFAVGFAAVLALAGCTTAPDATDRASGISGDAASALATTASFDYRYAYRLPGERVKDVLESHAAACDRLGPARCRILAMRYKVDDRNKIAAMLTFTIDPAIARAFGEAATRTVNGVDGMLVDTEIAGTGTTAAARSNALVARLREQLANADAQARNEANPDDRARATARSERLRTALSTIAEVEAGQGGTFAAAPVLITYTSGKAAAGLGGGVGNASFKDAGKSLQVSLAGLATLLANIGPWLLAMIVIVLGLRWLIHGRIRPEDDGYEPPVRDHAADEPEGRNLIQRWFNRDEDKVEEPA